MSAILGDLDELIGLIRRSAQQESLDIEAEARAKAARMQEDARANAQTLRAKLLAEASQIAQNERQRLLAQVTAENQRQRLTAREALLDQVWAEAERLLKAAPGDAGYADVLQRLAIAVAHRLEAEEVILAADPVGHALLAPDRLVQWSTETHFTATDQPAPIWGGLIARSVDGRRQVDASFAALLALARSQLRDQVAGCLGIV